MRSNFDLSLIEDLRPLAEIVQAIHDAIDSEAGRWLIVGATARELILRYAYQLAPGRRTVDLDVAVCVESWETFAAIEKRLLASGAQRGRNAAHEFTLLGWRIDALPFGGVEEDGTIVWPPKGDMVMSVAGFSEASEHAFAVRLPGDVSALVASPAGLLILKFFAWDERHRTRPLDDAADLRALIDSYAADWNQDRLYDDADDLLQQFGYDNALAAAALIGRDAAAIATPATLNRLGAILEREVSDESLALAAEMPRSTSDNVALLEAVLSGLRAIESSRH